MSTSVWKKTSAMNIVRAKKSTYIEKHKLFIELCESKFTQAYSMCLGESAPNLACWSSTVYTWRDLQVGTS